MNEDWKHTITIRMIRGKLGWNYLMENRDVAFAST